MTPHNKKHRPAETNKYGQVSGELGVRCRLVFARAAGLLGSKRLLTLVLSALVVVLAVVLRYVERLPPLSDRGSYVWSEEYDRLRRQRDDWESRCHELEAAAEEHTSVRDSLHVLWKELRDRWLINIPRSPSADTDTKINKHIQTVLRACGAYEGEIDGHAETTHLAVKNFQTTNRLKKVDGIIGPETWDCIINNLEELKGKPGNLSAYKYPQ